MRAATRASLDRLAEMPIGLGEKWLDARFEAHRARVRLAAHRARARTMPRPDVLALVRVAEGEVERAEARQAGIERAMETASEDRWDISRGRGFYIARVSP